VPWLLLTVALLLVQLMATSCAERLREPKPTPPEMGALLQAYATPTAPLDAGTIQQLLGPLEERFQLLERLDGLDQVFTRVIEPALAGEPSKRSGALTSSPAAAGASGSGVTAPPSARLAVRQQALDLEGEGFLRVRYICDGWEGPGVIDEAKNGRIELTINFTDQGVDPVVWGRFARCRYPAREHRLLLDAALQLHVGESIQVDTFGQSPILVRLLGSITIDDRLVETSDFDFRVDQLAGKLEIRLLTDDGNHLIYFTIPAQQQTQGFFAANGTWTCDLEQRRCSSEDQSSFSW